MNSIDNLSLTNCLTLQNKAKKILPGVSQLLSKRPDRFSEGIWPGYFKKAKGCEIWDLDDNKYLDMSIGGIGANILGYADDDVDNAVRAAINEGTSSSLNCPEDVELAELLCELHPWASKVKYARTGGEAMTVAVRIARAFTNRDTIAFCGYHGWHDWYLSANIGTQDLLKDHLQAGLKPLGVPRALEGTAIPFMYNDIKALEEIVRQNKNKLAAIVMEPIRNFEPEDDFLGKVQELASESGAVFIIDEISSGFRLNSGGAHLTFGIEPDIAVFSKGMSNGYPMAAVIGNSEVMDIVNKCFISSTYWTERIGPVAAIATIKKHRKHNVANHLIAIGKEVQIGIKKLSRKYELKIDITGIPPLTHFVINESDSNAVKALFIQLMLSQGFLVSNSFYSMYSHTKEHVRKYLDSVDVAFNQIKKAIEGNKINLTLLGKPSISGFNRLT